MNTEDQSEVIAFLGSPSTHGGAAVERIDTHASIVFIAGSSAWKLKRAVRYDYLDFSTVDRRRVMCEAEVRVNRRTAPTIYRSTIAVTRERDGSLALGGSGNPIDWVVEMTRFDQGGLFDRLAARGNLDLGLMRPLATTIARFHQVAERRPDQGGRSAMGWVIDGNATGFLEHGTGVLDPAICATVTSESHAAVGRCGVILDRRRDAGLVRQCHGDLHLRNIVLINGRPTLFDAIEFSDAIACTDVQYDLAFLLMDLWRRGLFRHANVVCNGYLAETEDFEGLSLLPLFLSCRAAVRAKTSVTAATLQDDPQRRTDIQQLARKYLEMALTLLRPPGPCLIAVGGFSGSGKSTLALTLAHLVAAVPGAVVLRSDELRKRLCGVAEVTRLGQEGYAPEVSRRVYEVLGARSVAILGAGHAAIVDAVFAQAAERRAVEQVAASASVPFIGLWLDAPEAVLVDRAKRRGIDPSDADAEVIRMQLAHDTGTVSWHRIDASVARDAVHNKVISVLENHIKSQLASERCQPPVKP